MGIKAPQPFVFGLSGSFGEPELHKETIESEKYCEGWKGIPDGVWFSSKKINEIGSKIKQWRIL
jgi:hypothetical protein